jgi:2-keto-4-pentenoate hydratase/2-oxohepta-3-ene-1,7-dioic acid hydratase in catechol pathway
VIGPGDTIRCRRRGRVEHEGELAVVMGKPALRPHRADAQATSGATRGERRHRPRAAESDSQWTRGKGPDTFCPLGPWLETDLDPADLRVRCEVDEVLRQDGRTRDLLPRRPGRAGLHHLVHDAAPGDSC